VASRARFQSLLRRWHEARESLVPSPSEVRTTNMLGGAWARRQGGGAWACQQGGSPKAGSGGAGAWPTRDRSSGAVVRGMPGREAMTHLVLDEGGVSGGTTP
jgi:hypothetical protein